MCTIDKFDYLIVNCGYAERLINHLDDINEYLAEMYDPIQILAVCGTGTAGGKIDNYTHQVLWKNDTNDNLIHEVEMNLGKFDILFKVGRLCDACAIVTHLMEYEHCKFFNFDNLMTMRVIEMTDEKYKDKIWTTNKHDIENVGMINKQHKIEMTNEKYKIEITNNHTVKKILVMTFDTESG